MEQEKQSVSESQAEALDQQVLNSKQVEPSYSDAAAEMFYLKLAKSRGAAQQELGFPEDNQASDSFFEGQRVGKGAKQAGMFSHDFDDCSLTSADKADFFDQPTYKKRSLSSGITF